MKTLKLLLFCSTLFTFHSALKADVDVDTLRLWFGGRFTNLRQAGADSTIPAMNLVTTQFWKTRTDGMWFLAEMSKADSTAALIGNTIFRIKRVEEGMIEVITFLVRDPTFRFNNDTARLERLTTNDLHAQPGCEMYLQATGTSFFGGTHGTGCLERTEKTSYKTTDLNIVLRGMVWSTRTFTSDGAEVLNLRLIFDRRK